MESIAFGIGITALAGALATVAGAAENTESDIGSQGDPNSQVQLAPQMGYIHRIFNKAITNIWQINRLFLGGIVIDSQFLRGVRLVRLNLGMSRATKGKGE